jgi:LacI family transcriptional regulator
MWHAVGVNERVVRRPATLTQVAEEAGVSPATASKALNGRADVADATRERVIAAADALGFTPNASARGLLSGRSGTVGLLTSDLEGRFVLPILMGAEDAFGKGKLDVFLCDARGDSVREQHHLQTLLGRRVDGIIVVGDRTDVRPSIGRDLPVPVVYVYAPSDDPQDLSLTPDGVMGGRVAAEHLLELGRRRIVAISGDLRYSAAHDRLGGARAVLQEAGMDFLFPPLFAEWTESWGRAAGALVRDPVWFRPGGAWSA